MGTPAASDKMAAHTENSRSLIYSRRRGRKLRPQRQILIRELLPKFAIKLDPSSELLDPAELFPGTKKNISGLRSASAPASI